MSDADCAVLIINPLRRTLAHYESELVETLIMAGRSVVEIADTVPGDVVTGPINRVVVTIRTVWARMRLARSERGKIVVVVWPLFGYLEPLTWMRMARHNTVYIIVHDPSPLRRSYGQSRWARGLFKAATRHAGVEVLYHTEHAQKVGVRLTGVRGAVIPHPIRIYSTPTTQRRGPEGFRPVVRVLGQYKQTRSLSALAEIADQASEIYALQIHGCGWPQVEGWSVKDHFVPEDEFTDLVQSSDCIVIPYDLFFQSGVAVRCLEAGVPVVAPIHEHIVQLYGDDWVGVVRQEGGWHKALESALAVNLEVISARRRDLAQKTSCAWRNLLEGGERALREERS